MPYGWVVRCRNAAYDAGWLPVARAAVPVVSVGNLTLGGTGKSPCVETLARFYRERGVRVALLSRGYGAREGLNDEARMLAANLPGVPQLQGVDRVALARTAVRECGAEVLLLDDGFQHRRLARDLDIVLIDATCPWGHGRLFPRGLLREPPAGLSRAHLILLTRCDQASAAERERLREEIGRVAPGTPLVETTHRPLEWVNAEGKTLPLDALVKQRVVGFCGIGNPEAFRQTLIALGMDVAAFRPFPDHHAYSPVDTVELEKMARDGVVLTTQKDLVKLRRTELGGRALWALRIGLHVTSGQEALERQLTSILASLKQGRASIAQGGADRPAPSRSDAEAA